MKRTPRWLLWSGLALTVWAAAVWLTWGVLGPREAGLRAEEMSLSQQQAEAKGLVASAPRVVAQIDSVETEIRDHLARLTTTDEIPRLLSELQEEGMRRQLDAVRTELGLHSTMRIPLVDEVETKGEFTIHSLRLALGVEGTFQAIGSWLDTIENRADFQQWIECRWEKETDDRRIRFSGEAEFWVITTPAADRGTSGDQGE
ncbi:MAG TPA: type 4a pilus biogenesis protein PilO [Acidobacteriota bacterium]|nr:type 4a pilus biogenesis protein PilO [Acidobacteriota bacterium]